MFTLLSQQDATNMCLLFSAKLKCCKVCDKYDVKVPIFISRSYPRSIDDPVLTYLDDKVTHVSNPMGYNAL